MSRTLSQLCSTAATASAMLMAALMVISTTANAGDLATNSEITAAVVDKTYQGSMTKNSFAEYYASDGSIKGKDYAGKWRVTNNTMCFTYGDKPEVCWGLEINGPAVTLYKDGKVDGAGMLVDGNLHNF